jgi:Asp-tRNA(Asn)/Glu-tRNA(Gln) amidotransferase A subunit family amidase
MFRYAYLQRKYNNNISIWSQLWTYSTFTRTEWNTVALEMDVMLCPTFPTPAPHPTTLVETGATTLYSISSRDSLVSFRDEADG